MSRHIAHAFHEGRPVTVIAGYDRPLRELFLQVRLDTRADATSPAGDDETFIYTSLNEPRRDWTDIKTVIDALESLKVKVPQGLIDEIRLDQCFDEGNRFVVHSGRGFPGS